MDKLKEYKNFFRVWWYYNIFDKKKILNSIVIKVVYFLYLKALKSYDMNAVACEKEIIDSNSI